MIVQRPPIPAKNNSKILKSPQDNRDFQTTPPKDLSPFFQTPIPRTSDDNSFTPDLLNERFARIIQEKNDEIELLKSKLGVSEVSAAQFKSLKSRLASDLEEKTAENRLEISKLKGEIDEKRAEIENLNAKIIIYEDLSQENSILQAKISDIESSNKKLISELTAARESNIEIEAESLLLKNQNKMLESEITGLRNFEKTINSQLSRKNEQIESLRRYLNSLELKFKDLSKISDLEKYLVLTTCEIERLQKVLTKKTEEIEFLGKKTIEMNNALKNMGNYEKTISNLVLENENLRVQLQEKAQQKIEFEGLQRKDFEGSNIKQVTRQNEFPIRKNSEHPYNDGHDDFQRIAPQNTGKSNGTNKDFETIYKEYQKVFKENVGLADKVEKLDDEMSHLRALLKGKESEIFELRNRKKDAVLEKTLKFNDGHDLEQFRRKFTD